MKPEENPKEYLKGNLVENREENQEESHTDKQSVNLSPAQIPLFNEIHHFTENLHFSSLLCQNSFYTSQ